ncbi:MAG TPA: hypothetical protein VFS42_11570 [Burkholderiaceae bacterium]|nr:hypothetical protein [Burkholderiaceae bacterium]
MRARFYLFALMVLFVAGCATQSTPPAAPPPPSVGPIDQAISRWDELSKSGQADKAKELMANIKREYPARKEPWLKQAQLQFDAGNYGQAVLDAQEALRRDPADRTALGIVAVSGLRVSASALADLVRREGVPGSVRDEAAIIAKSLRESLGESVLVPPPPVVEPVATPAPAPAPKPVRVKSTRPAPSNASPAKNPFEALK